MVQGQLKPKAGGAGVKKKASPGPKRGGTKIAPKKAQLVRQLQMKKKLTASTIVATERQMAAKAGATGKLTIMRDVADKAIKETKKAAAAAAAAKKPAPAAAKKKTGKK
ncbi:hypothetical protein HDU67_007216 [Dinochytrium kinnereticum]|nr:hypothetical protein HDU67_007216 [Dinochytrium kinnereticum]